MKTLTESPSTAAKVRVSSGYQSVDPNTGKVVKTFEILSDAQLEEKLAAAASCFEKWRHTTYTGRAAIISKAASILHERADQFARIMTQEMGKRISEARGEVEFSSQILSYYAENAERFLAPVELHPTLGEAFMESSPLV